MGWVADEGRVSQEYRDLGNRLTSATTTALARDRNHRQVTETQPWARSQEEGT